MQIRCVIVDDEPHARMVIREFLLSDEDLVILTELKNGREAVKYINANSPDLIFLDIQMPDITGFEVIKNLKSGYEPVIIFTTAYDQYALKAFEASALDYLLKPFDEERFIESVDKAKKRIKLNQAGNFNKKLEVLFNQYKSTNQKFLSHFEIREKGRTSIVNTEDIYFVEAAGVYVKLVSKNGKHLYRVSLNSLESTLNPAQFKRIHRSYLININEVEKSRYLSNNKYSFLIKNGEKIVSGRSYKALIHDFLSY